MVSSFCTKIPPAHWSSSQVFLTSAFTYFHQGNTSQSPQIPSMCASEGAVLHSHQFCPLVSAHVSEGPMSWRNRDSKPNGFISAQEPGQLPHDSLVLQRCRKGFREVKDSSQPKQQGVLYSIFPNVMVRGLYTLVTQSANHW